MSQNVTQNRFIKDYQHWLSKQIVENTKANTLIIGDLAVKEMKKRTSHYKSRRKKRIYISVN